MDKATLVKSDLEIQGLVMEALSRARIPITLCDWNYVPQLDEWQLVIATPWFDIKGPHETNSRIIKAFQEAGIYEEVPMRRLFIKSPHDPLARALEQEIKFRNEGEIFIIDHSRPNHKKVYSVIFMPFTGPGGTVPAKHISDLTDLRSFLEDRLHIHKSSVHDALLELQRKGSASIFHVQLTNREAKKLGLA